MPDAFDDLIDNLPSYPCKCGGNFVIHDMHVISGYCGDPPDICCDTWKCNKCGYIEKQCEDWKGVDKIKGA